MIKHNTWNCLVIFSLIRIMDIIKIIIGEVVEIIALLIGVESDRPFNDAIIFILIPNSAHNTNLIRSFFSIYSFGKNRLIAQNSIAAPKTLTYNNAPGDIKSGINSLAIVW